MISLLAIPLLLATAQDPFEAVRQKAHPVENTDKLLQAWAGACEATDPVEAQECATRAKVAQAEFKGKSLHLNLGGGFERLMEPLDAPNGKAAMLLTPIFDVGAGVALTFAKPTKLDKDGTILVPRMPVEGALLDDSLTAGDIKRLLKTGQLAVEVVGTVKGAWELKRKGGDPVKGVEFNVTAVRFSNRRTGKALFSHVK